MIYMMNEIYLSSYPELVQEWHPIGRILGIANVVLFLCSDEAKYITGTEIMVDGSLTASIP